MTASDLELPELRHLLDAEEELISGYEAAFRRIEAEGADRREWMAIVSAAQFGWLHELFSCRWLSSPQAENALLLLKPEAKLFNAIHFERLIQALLGMVEGKRFEPTQVSHDEGIDLIHTERVVFEGDIDASATTVVQCKLYRGHVAVTELRDFFGAMVARTASGLFFTSGRLTAQGRRFVQEANSSSMANRLHVVAGDDLTRVLTLCRRLYDLVVEFEEDTYKSVLAAREQARQLIYAPPIQRQGRLL